MHLGHRGGGQRLALEAAEHLVDGRAELLLDQRHRLLGRERRHLVLQVRQLVGDVRRQQVAAGGQQLAELDEHRAEVFQAAAQALAARHRDGLARQPAPGHGAQQAAQPPGQRQVEQQVVELVAGGGPLDADQAAQGEQLHAVSRFP
ncbi:hypothetical protein D3C78_1285300 [compost metagenome]